MKTHKVRWSQLQPSRSSQTHKVWASVVLSSENNSDLTGQSLQETEICLNRLAVCALGTLDN